MRSGLANSVGTCYNNIVKADIINDKYVRLGTVRSVIRALFEYGNARKAQIGEENVFDFSLGNPNVPPPAEFDAVVGELLAACGPVTLHGYAAGQGAAGRRPAVAD